MGGLFLPLLFILCPPIVITYFGIVAFAALFKSKEGILIILGLLFLSMFF
jgi:hypothetical protein